VTRALSLIAAALVTAVCLVAQTPIGAVAGRAADKAGIPFPGVAVTLGGPSLSQPRTAVTDAGGDYQFPGVPDGTYHLTFQLLGFCTVTEDDVIVAAGARVRANASITESASHLRCPGDTGALVVRIDTAFGHIDIALDAAHAPVTVINFLKYVDGHFYDGGQFHRATRPDNYTPAPPNRPMMELIQGGIDPARRRDGFPPIPLERTSVTGLKHLTGTVSMARGTGADTATSDFFILLDDQPSLDFGGKRFDDGQGGAAFGQVVDGLDVVRKIQQQPVQGQNLTPPVTMIRASRVR
jgi:peptidyl-prolyl cis-trans isomerase A (cyclophilin A)